ncbi:hypothetical protein [Marinirhabdus gelatinilytica]|uniref:Spy/CpxP family protein refolding chaperone n=1 Tax=Marinirhabdus gelatinilytica TaxID=1703343 RepID=A0A370Q7J9_9FLAO|nr:hypothetical protein [Marinirhabdus gelatinilytica]RDK84334.1 hypothetical protein C8D94_105180 [Marinirhabdus gelatinilytica]
MKKLVLIALALCTLTLSAQPGDHSRKRKKEFAEKKNDWTPEQKAELATKQMALKLDLTEAQQQKIYPIQLTMVKDREQLRAHRDKKEELTSEELFVRKKEQLEKRLQTKEQLKAILTPEQFELWKKTHKRKRNRKKSERKHRGR